MHFQDLVKQASDIAQNSGTEIALYLDPYSEFESDQLGYCPVLALDMFKHYIVLGYVSPTGDVTLRTIG